MPEGKLPPVDTRAAAVVLADASDDLEHLARVMLGEPHPCPVCRDASGIRCCEFGRDR